MKTRFRMVIATLVLGVLVAPMSTLFAPAQVAATGSVPTSASATAGQITWYYKDRPVTNPQLAGPEVAFYQSSGISGVFLGTHNCSQGDAGPIYPQYNGTVQPVRYYPIEEYVFPVTFCVLSYANVSGDIYGTLYWD